MSRLFPGLVLVCVCALLAVPAFADEFTLHNHPDGGARPPLYGLRLDGLLDGDSAKIYTFDFDDTDNGAAMFMTISGSTLHIHGKAWGGRDDGSAYVDPTLWDIDFTYTGVTLADDGADDDLWVKSDVAQASVGGTIKRSDGTGETTSLRAEAGNHPFYFRLGDEADDSGHRMDGGISGWGWLNHATPGAGTSLDEHLYASDWLFTAQPVPEPGTLALLGLGLIGVFGVTRRRTRGG